MKFDYLENRRNEALAITALTVISALVRFRPLRDPLWGDEAVTYGRHGMAPVKDLLFHFWDPNQHTLFSILSNVCIRLFGENEFWFRFPAFLAGALALPVFYRLGAHVLDSKAASFLASCLLIFSHPHLFYSFNGRGYTLTFFLVLVLIFSVTKVAHKAGFAWSSLLVLSGFGLVLTLPTNAFFLAGAAGYGFALILGTEESRPVGFFRGCSRVFIPFFILLVLVVGYFSIIYLGLLNGVKNVSPHVTKGSAFFSETAVFLISPWSPWCYVFFLAGLLRMRSQKMLISFSTLFLIPLVLTFATGLIGYARVYIYWLPFLLMAVAQGMMGIAEQIQRRNALAAYAFIAVLAVGMLVEPARSLPRPSESQEVSMADARRALSYIEEKVPHDRLILVASRNYVLNRYLEERIKRDMFSFINGVKPERILFLHHKDLPPGAQVFDGYFPGSEMRLPAHGFKPVAMLGNLRLYELDLKIFRFIPPVYEPDYEAQLGFQGSVFNTANDPKVLGEQVLIAQKQGGPVRQYPSQSIKTVDIREREAFTLSVYIRKYGQKSKMFLGEYDEKLWPPPKMAYLNTFLGEFKTAELGFSWQMVFVIAPVAGGRHQFQEFIHLEDEIGYFDAFQSFLLVKPAG